MTNLEKKIEALLENTITNLGYELYDVIYAKEVKDYYLRIFIDSKEGISLEDCEKVSNAISDILDEADYIKDAYFLEVSSAGIERVLRQDKHFKDNIGKEVEVKLFKPIEKQKIINGILKEANSEEIQIQTEETSMRINKENIALIKTIYKW